jgi:hypothetical protein
VLGRLPVGVDGKPVDTDVDEFDAIDAVGHSVT